jgi:hypothetical protein
MAVLGTISRSRLRRPRKWLRGLLTLALLIMASGPKLCAQSPTTSEYLLKAVFLFNFTQFVEWPPEVFPSSTAPIVIGVLGSDPFGSLLDETVRDEHVGGRPLTVQRFERVEDAVGCHVLYISASESRRLEEIVTHLHGRGVLTVCDSERVVARGVMIRIVNERSRIRLRINLDAAKAAGLTISSKLLRAAEIVSAEGE